MRYLLAPAVAAAIVLTPAAAFADSGNKCAESAAYGSSCIAITGSGLQVTDVQGYFTPPNRDYLTHRRWALMLTAYSCDPRGRPQSQCRQRHRWFTRVRHGNPPKNSSFCTVFEPGGVGFEQCQDFGIAYADANFRDWRGFHKLPHQFRHDTWLCSELAVRAHRHWHRNGAAGSPGVRGCAEVHG